MEELYGDLKIDIKKETLEIKLTYKPTGTILERIRFIDSRDFCKWILKLTREIGIGRMEFASACNAVSDEIKDWGNLSGKEND